MTGTWSTVTYRAIDLAGDDRDYLDRVVDIVCALMEELGEVWDRDSIEQTTKTCVGAGVTEFYGAFYGNELVGSVAFYIQPELWNYKKMVATEAYWYVYPTHRGAIGSGLLEFVEKTLNIDTIVFGMANETLQKFMFRKGYRPLKMLVHKEIG